MPLKTINEQRIPTQMFGKNSLARSVKGSSGEPLKLDTTARPMPTAYYYFKNTRDRVVVSSARQYCRVVILLFAIICCTGTCRIWTRIFSFEKGSTVDHYLNILKQPVRDQMITACFSVRCDTLFQCEKYKCAIKI